MVEGLAPPTRAVVHSHDTICRRLRIQYVFLHMCGVNQFWIIVFFAAVKLHRDFCLSISLFVFVVGSVKMFAGRVKYTGCMVSHKKKPHVDPCSQTCCHKPFSYFAFLSGGPVIVIWFHLMFSSHSCGVFIFHLFTLNTTFIKLNWRTGLLLVSLTQIWMLRSCQLWDW